VRLLSFVWGGVKRVGVYVNNVVVDLPETYMRVYETDYAPVFLYDMKSLIEGGEPIIRLIKDLVDNAVRSGNAVNYREHGKESSAKPPDRPYFFPKFPNTLIGHKQPILKPRVSRQVDWEVELALIIGRKGKYIDVNRALDHVFGYLILNDISMRD
jgi:hypothetical protein